MPLKPLCLKKGVGGLVLMPFEVLDDFEARKLEGGFLRKKRCWGH